MRRTVNPLKYRAESGDYLRWDAKIKKKKKLFPCFFFSDPLLYSALNSSRITDVYYSFYSFTKTLPLNMVFVYTHSLQCYCEKLTFYKGRIAPASSLTNIKNVFFLSKFLNMVLNLFRWFLMHFCKILEICSKNIFGLWNVLVYFLASEK